MQCSLSLSLSLAVRPLPASQPLQFPIPFLSHICPAPNDCAITHLSSSSSTTFWSICIESVTSRVACATSSSQHLLAQPSPAICRRSTEIRAPVQQPTANLSLAAGEQERLCASTTILSNTAGVESLVECYSIESLHHSGVKSSLPVCGQTPFVSVSCQF